MKATITQLKKKINTISNPTLTGIRLSTSNPYWANEKQIGYIKKAFIQVIEDGNNNPEKRYTPTGKQIISLNNWIDGLSRKYI